VINLDYPTGFYGKLPSHGDFLSRRLPRQFIEPWDHWLQAGLAASREQLGVDWLNTFLVSPIWHFALTQGLCGENAWSGVMMPSVDRVGRYFPLTLAAKVDDCLLAELFAPECGWFEALSQLALFSLEYEFELQAFDEQLESLRLSDFLSLPPDTSQQVMLKASSSRLAFQFQLDSNIETPQAFADLRKKLNNRFLPNCSYWRSRETENSKPALLLCEGLPPTDAYVGFLNGEWPQRGWHYSSSRASRVTTVTSESIPKAVDIDPLQTLLVNQFENKDATTNSSDPQSVQIPTKLQSCALSVIGLRRKINEDAILERTDVGMWAVADGMGGHSAGDVASQALIAALAKIPCVDDLEHYSEQVASTLQTVNRELLELAQSRGRDQVIGSTIVVLLISGKQFRYLWAGDSRLYRYRHGELEQLTKDHSLYNESISLGLKSNEGSSEQGRGNIITRAVGADLLLQLDYGQGDIASDDMFLLCSDGLDKELNHADIETFCSAGSVSDIAYCLVREAENRGGRDNISVIVVSA